MNTKIVTKKPTKKKHLNIVNENAYYITIFQVHIYFKNIIYK